MKLVSVLKPNYWIALQTLAWSLHVNGNLDKLIWIIIWDGTPPAGSKDFIARCGFRPVFIPIKEMGRPSITNIGRPEDSWAKWLHNKFLIWRLPPDDYLYLDADLMCLDSARGISRHTPFSVVRERPEEPDRLDFNTGFMLIRPEPGFERELVEYYNTQDTVKTYRLGDQGLLNAFMLQEYENDIKYLSPKWNTLSIYARTSIPPGTKFVHLVGPKPWVDFRGTLPHTLWQELYNASEKERAQT